MACFARPPWSAHPPPYGGPLSAGGRGDGLNFAFTPSDSPRPFDIEVYSDLIATTKLKSPLYRPTKNIAVPAWADGPPAQDIETLQQYFLTEYSWSDVQADINSRYASIQFTTTVSAGPNYTDPVYLHFAHPHSEQADGIPLLMAHDFPSSFLEFEYVIDALAAPPIASLPAFHVVTPNLPGFAFLPPQTADGRRLRVSRDRPGVR